MTDRLLSEPTQQRGISLTQIAVIAVTVEQPCYQSWPPSGGAPLLGSRIGQNEVSTYRPGDALLTTNAPRPHRSPDRAGCQPAASREPVFAAPTRLASYDPVRGSYGAPPRRSGHHLSCGPPRPRRPCRSPKGRQPGAVVCWVGLRRRSVDFRTGFRYTPVARRKRDTPPPCSVPSGDQDFLCLPQAMPAPNREGSYDPHI